MINKELDHVNVTISFSSKDALSNEELHLLTDTLEQVIKKQLIPYNRVTLRIVQEYIRKGE